MMMIVLPIISRNSMVSMTGVTLRALDLLAPRDGRDGMARNEGFGGRKSISERYGAKR